MLERLQQADAGRLPHQGRLAQASLDIPPGDGGGVLGAINADCQEGQASHLFKGKERKPTLISCKAGEWQSVLN